jgi:hypothetical protein
MNTLATVTKLNARGGPLVAPRKGRARPTNGSCTHVGGDPNTPAARRYRDILAGYRAELGHEPTAIEDTMTRQAASLALQHEQRTRAQVAGKRVATDELTSLSSEWRRIMTRLGIAGNGATLSEADRLRMEREDREAGLIP